MRANLIHKDSRNGNIFEITESVDGWDADKIVYTVYLNDESVDVQTIEKRFKKDDPIKSALHVYSTLFYSLKPETRKIDNLSNPVGALKDIIRTWQQYFKYKNNQ